MCNSEATQDETETVVSEAPIVAPHDCMTCKYCKILANLNQGISTERELIRVESLDAHFGDVTSFE